MNDNSNDNLLGIVDKIESPQPAETKLFQLGRKDFRPKRTIPATLELAIAREAAARIEREDGYDRCAEHRLAGAYDGDEETRIALATIAILRERGMLIETGEAA